MSVKDKKPLKDKREDIDTKLAIEQIISTISTLQTETSHFCFNETTFDFSSFTSGWITFRLML